MDDLISVVMAAYNGERFIAEQLDSILAQTYRKLEIICVDDASKDGTVEILERYGKEHPGRIKVFRNAENIGSRKTFEQGCRESNGGFIAFSDQDDWWYPRKLETLHGKISRDERIAFVYSNAEVVNDRLETIQERVWTDEKEFFRGRGCLEVLYRNRVMGCTMLARADFVRGCLPFADTVYHHDKYMALMASALDLGIEYVFEPLIKYRQHEQNLISGAGKVERKYRKKKKTRGSFRSREKALARYERLRAFDFDAFRNQALRVRMEYEMKMLEAMLHRRPFQALYYFHKFYRKANAPGYIRTRYSRHDLELVFRCLLF